MKKIILLVGLLLICSSMFSQEISLSVGRIMTSANGNAINYDVGYETNYTLRGRYFLNDKLAVAGSVTRDTVKVANWLEKHNFLTVGNNNVQYTKASLGLEYHFNSFYIYGAVPMFMSSNKSIDSKIGIEAGLGYRYFFNKHWGVGVSVSYCYVEDFIVPVANVIFSDVGVIYKW